MCVCVCVCVCVCAVSRPMSALGKNSEQDVIDGCLEQLGVEVDRLFGGEQREEGQEQRDMVGVALSKDRVGGRSGHPETHISVLPSFRTAF